MAKTSESPSIYSFLNFADYLVAFHDFRKSQQKSYSYRQLARRAGLSTPDYLKSIIKGKRRLVASRILDLADACALGPQEKLYFQALVEWNQAKSSHEKQFAWEKLVRLTPKNDLYVLNDTEVNVLSDWYILAIYELVRFAKFKADVYWIINQFGDRLKPAQINKALKILVEAGLIAKEGASYKQVKGAVFKGSDLPSEIIKNYHNMAIQEGIHALFNVDVLSREFAAAVIAVRKEDIAALKDEVRKFHKTILSFQDRCDQPNVLIQLNTQLFPLTLLN